MFKLIVCMLFNATQLHVMSTRPMLPYNANRSRWKVSRLHDLVIREKTFATVQQFETRYNKIEKLRWKTFTIGG